MKLTAKDLRCGNTLNYYTAEGDILPTTIDWQDIKWVSEDEEGFNSVHAPIPLTEEWLLRLGFQKFKLSCIHNRFEFKGFIILQRIANNQFWFYDNLRQMGLRSRASHFGAIALVGSRCLRSTLAAAPVL